MNTLQQSVEIVADAWKSSTYYDHAEAYTDTWWNKSGDFFKQFSQLDLTATLELACGHGRHSVRVAGKAERLVLMDVLQENVEFSAQRLSGTEVEVIQNNGYDFAPLQQDELTAIFCYDAMVHFSPDLVLSYLRDASRVLRPGGMALFQHSNYDAPDDRHYGQNPHARNRMTERMIRGFADYARMEIVETTPMSWGSNQDYVADLDRLTLFRKPVST